MDAGPKQATAPSGQVNSADPVGQTGQPQPQQQQQQQQQQDYDNLPDSEIGPVEDGILLARVNVPELYISKCLQFPKDQLVWDVKQQCLASLPKVSYLVLFTAAAKILLQSSFSTFLSIFLSLLFLLFNLVINC